MTKEKKPLNRTALSLAAFILVVIGGLVAGGAYIAVSGKTVAIDKAAVEAPQATLAPSAAGVLQHVYVKTGDIIAPNTVVAQVGVELIKSTQGGLVISVRTDTGTIINAGETVATLIDPSQLRVVGQVQEDKGLTDVHVGAAAYFTVDAFGSKRFSGIVDEVSPTSNTGDVVFSVSDKREEQSFDVKVRFNTDTYPELKNGMSAKLWIYKQ